MNQIKVDWGLKEDPLPADYFDLIGGTSTGGLIALLLGRLRLSVPEARTEFTRIVQHVFTLERRVKVLINIPLLGPYVKREIFDERRLEAAVRRVLVARLGQGRGDEKLFDRSDGRCRVFVCAKVLQVADAPRLFRTYDASGTEPSDCRIWEACRATMAAPAYFKGINIGVESERETFVGAGLGCNDPIQEVLAEARRVFPAYRKIACAVSIGTGTKRAPKARSGLPLTTRRKAIERLEAFATSEDDKAQAGAKFDKASEAYFRLNVDGCLGSVGLENWRELGQVRSLTTRYLDQNEVSDQIRKIAKVLVAQDSSSGASLESSPRVHRRRRTV
ncbi:Acyl transferase/acyl hydrolase/lysophospholipase [Cordyceps fumosorosea ARSEF 2679]|uniref:Acyl transferase/acyl hydrolase/lysophospholipase n=1 Tax=Cordyceps fumosorosea (strain ARSEF 2679) TaxID=1081104 RepID=A0A162MSL1_CORFA|nr:Acyl transferase/acyl hydrolase/lysophospholipase [Cordyceps fumosorosea ARSEF 2679]OAA66300.1 Acyl transferase/acyl hydrolase/lysophospholipase [Cordyceps fumosorosea ARSEF 2679]